MIHFTLAVDRINDDQLGLPPAGMMKGANELWFHMALLICLPKKSVHLFS
jgi:hypothetical protein